MFKKRPKTAQQKAQQAQMRVLVRFACCAYIIFYVILPLIKNSPEDNGMNPKLRTGSIIVFIAITATFIVVTTIEVIRNIKKGIYKASSYTDDGAEENAGDEADDGADSETGSAAGAIEAGDGSEDDDEDDDEYNDDDYDEDDDDDDEGYDDETVNDDDDDDNEDDENNDDEYVEDNDDDNDDDSEDE